MVLHTGASERDSGNTWGYVDKTVEATGNHFNLPGPSKADMQVMVVEKVNSRDLWLREEREHELIRNCNTYYKGINRKI